MLSCFLYSPIIQIPHPGNSATHSEWVFPQESRIDIPTSQPNLDSPSRRLDSQVILNCVRVIIKASHHKSLCWAIKSPDRPVTGVCSHSQDHRVYMCGRSTRNVAQLTERLTGTHEATASTSSTTKTGHSGTYL